MLAGKKPAKKYIYTVPVILDQVTDKGFITKQQDASFFVRVWVWAGGR